MAWYALLVLAVARQRRGEPVRTRRDATWTGTRRGAEQGHGHYPVVIVCRNAAPASAAA